MRYIFINTTSFGSTGNICKKIMTGLNQHGHETKLICGYGNNSVSPNVEVVGERKASRLCNSFLTKVHGGDGFHNKANTRKIISKIQDFNPDCVCIHNLHGHYINIKMLFNYLAKKKVSVFFTLHDCYLFTGGCSHFLMSNCNAWITDECAKCSFKKHYPVSLFKRRSNSFFKTKKALLQSLLVKGIITPSQWLNNLVSESFLKGYERVVINNGVSRQVFFSDNSNKQNEKPLIMCCSSIWDETKGINELIDFASKTVKKYNFLVIGKLDKKYSFSSNVKYVPFIDDSEKMVKMYQSSDVFFSPSHEDNYPTVLIESICCGVPVICFDTGGSKEITKNKYGIIIENNFESFDRAVETIMNNNIYKDNCSHPDDGLFEENMVNQYCKLLEL